jgi:cytochrome c oxidase subunit 2
MCGVVPLPPVTETTHPAGVYPADTPGTFSGGVTRAILIGAAGHDTASSFAGLFRDYLIVLCAFGGVVALAIVFMAVRYRGAGRTASTISEATRTELAWVAIVAVAVAVLLTLTFRTENGEDALAADPYLRIGVTASQWQWRFTYPNGHVEQGPGATLTVPQGKVVEFDLRSRDVLHAMWIPALRFKRYAYPDHRNRFDLVFTRPGRSAGLCSQFCGLDHDQMRFTVRVLAPDAFSGWLASAGAS